MERSAPVRISARTSMLAASVAVAICVFGTVVKLNAEPLVPGKTRFGGTPPPAVGTAGERVSVLVHLEAGADRGPVRGFAAAQGGQVKYEYDILPNVINLRGIPQGALAALAATPGVVRWEPDGEVHAHMNDSMPHLRGLQSQLSAAGISADGTGIRVCIIDTGIDSDHAMYSTRIDTAAGRDFVNNDNNPEDDAGHGSHVAGTAVGGDNLTVDFGCVGPEPFHGMAPQATLIGIKVLAANGSGSFSDVIAGINYGADQTASGGRCDVINMSLGGGGFTGTCDGDSAAAASNNAVDAGVVVISSSGNDGFANAMGTPACASKVISVGMTFDDSYPSCEFPGQTSFSWCFNPPGCSNSCVDNTPSLDDVSCLSNQSDELDVTAPGCITFSADKDNSPNGIVGFCGTSMSAPHVAGLAALLLDLDGSLTPAEVRTAIRDGAIDLGPAGFDRGYGHGRIDVINSLNSIGPECSVPADCDDADACTVDDCVGGSCTNTPVSCPPGEVCSGGVCIPEVCNNDGTCDAGEDCNNCSNDCISGTTSGATCGNDICEAGDGEDCVSCAADCNGKQNGNPNGRFCCGDGDGQNPLPCSDPVCTEGAFDCTDVPTGGGGTFCCGDGTCEGDEDSFNCAVDCGDPPVCGDASCDAGEDECNCAADCCAGAPASEAGLCSDGCDNDCDGLTDGDDPDCACVAKNDPCNVDADCCSNICKNNGTCR